MKKGLLLALAVLLLPLVARAEGEQLDHVQIDLGNKAELQRGARTFVNYCLSCHSASYMRYGRIGQDLGISNELVKKDLMFGGGKIGDLMTVAMRSSDAKKWFGTAPPDLTLIARSRGPDWIYTYLRSFYRDDSTASGWNNLVFPHVAMPNVLWQLQGQQVLAEGQKQGEQKAAEGQTSNGLKLAQPGTESPQQFDHTVRDLTDFLVYLGEPAALVRPHIGYYVLAFLVVFWVVAYLLKREYWKDVH